jgi:hypothetical protein
LHTGLIEIDHTLQRPADLFSPCCPECGERLRIKLHQLRVLCVLRQKKMSLDVDVVSPESGKVVRRKLSSLSIIVRRADVTEVADVVD